MKHSCTRDNRLIRLRLEKQVQELLKEKDDIRKNSIANTTKLERLVQDLKFEIELKDRVVGKKRTRPTESYQDPSTEKLP